MESASTARIDVSRRIKNPASVEETDTLTENYSFAINDKFEIEGSEGFVLQPYDQVYVRRSPGYSPQTHVRIEGEVLFPGSYALKHKETRISDVIKLAGGTSSWAYVKGARLSRQMTEEEATPVFKRNRISNQRETVDMVVSAAAWLDEETVLRKLPFLTVDEVEAVMKRKGKEEAENAFKMPKKEEVEVEE